MQRIRQIVRSLLLGACATLLVGGAASAQSPQWSDRAFLNVNLGMQLTANPFVEHIAPIIYSEPASIRAPNAVAGGLTTLDLAGGIRVWKSVGVGAAYTKQGMTENVDVAALVPNPVFFSQSRAASAVTPLRRAETAVHIQALYVVPITPRIDVVLSGGPSLIDFSQDFVSGIEVTEGAAPYTSVAIGNVGKVTRTERLLGVNVGADVTYFLTTLAGAGCAIRYTSGTVTTQQGDGSTIDLSRGGFQVAFGARIRLR